MRAWRLLAAAALLALAGCAPTATPGSATGPQDGMPAAAGSTAAAAPVASVASATDATTPASGGTPTTPAVVPEPPPTGATATAPPADASASPAPPSLACDSDADCAVKDVGSCCGYRPACVNAEAETFPEQVKARCAADGRMGICGFEPVSGCQCVEGQCSAITEAIGPAPPKALQ